MRYKFIISLVLFSLVFNKVFASENSTLYYLSRGIKKPLSTVKPNSLNWIIINYNQSNHMVENECESSNGNYPLFDPDNHKEQFELTIGVEEDESSGSDKTVLNVTISNVTFSKLKIIQQALVTSPSDLKIYETIQFEENEQPQKLIILFSVTAYHRTRLQLFADDGRDGFFKEYQFIPPSSSSIKSRGAPIERRLFSYVDTTALDKVWLYVQPLPENYNISRYIGEFLERDLLKKHTDTHYMFNITDKYLQYLDSNFIDGSSYDVKLTPVDNNGPHNSSVRVASFCKDNHQSLVIMIVSITAVPLVTFCVLYVAYSKYKNRFHKWLETKQPRCLIVYATTHQSHIDFVKKLIEYLNSCHITAVDLFDVPTKTHPDPSIWCDQVFHNANCVVVIPSPGCENTTSTTITPYIHLFTHTMVLIHGNRCRKDKNYLRVKLPYNESDVPDGVRGITCLEIKNHKDVKKLVDMIHDAEYTEEFKVSNAQEIVDSIESAYRNISHGEPYITPEQPNDLKPPSTDKVIIDVNDESDEEDPALPIQQSRAPGKFHVPIHQINLMGNLIDLESPEEI